MQFGQLKRREFILLRRRGGGMVAARAQQGERVRPIGVTS
jgi:hypothetical protein